MFIGLVSFMLALLLATTAMTVSQCSSSPDDPPDSSQKISAPTETDTGTPAQPTMVLRTNRPDTREPIYVDPPEPVAAPPMPAPMAPSPAPLASYGDQRVDNQPKRQDATQQLQSNAESASTGWGPYHQFAQWHEQCTYRSTNGQHGTQPQRELSGMYVPRGNNIGVHRSLNDNGDDWTESYSGCGSNCGIGATIKLVDKSRSFVGKVTVTYECTLTRWQ